MHCLWIVQQQKGIYASLLVFDDGSEAIAEGELTDTLSVLANFQALQTIADQTRTCSYIYMCILSSSNTSFLPSWPKERGNKLHVARNANHACDRPSHWNVCVSRQHLQKERCQKGLPLQNRKFCTSTPQSVPIPQLLPMNIICHYTTNHTAHVHSILNLSN